MIFMQIQSFESLELPDLFGESKEVIVLKVKELEVPQAPDLGRQKLELVVPEVELGKVREFVDVADPNKFVSPEVELPQLRQVYLAVVCVVGCELVVVCV